MKTAEDLRLPVPQLAPRPSDGKREIETVVLQPSPELEQFIDHIADRAEKVAAKRVDPRDDNMLLISTDGRKAALDLRLIDEHAVQTGPVKLDAVAQRVATIWEETKGREYRDDATGQTSPVRGALQLVFSDLGTPNEKRWNAYSELKTKLVEHGMPADSIRFMHEAKDDKAKGRLFAAARAGHVAVLIGSTSKMGVGTNVQSRLVAMHHVDCPWRPADLEQRDGRGIRQGNQNPEVAIFRYVVERSFDAYSWQMIGRKATFIAQVMRGKLDTREIEDIGDTAMSAAEAKALASGNPLVLEKATADAEHQKLRRQETAFHRARSAAQFTLTGAQQRATVAEAQLVQLRDALKRTTPVGGEAFTMIVDGAAYDSRADAAAAIAQWTRSHELDWHRASAEPIRLGGIGGHDILVSAERDTYMGRVETVARVELRDVPLSGSRGPISDLRDAGVGFVRTLENKTTTIERNIDYLERELAKAQDTISEARTSLARPFPHAAALAAAAQRVRQVDEALAASNKADTEPVAEPDAARSRAIVGASFAAAPTASLAPVNAPRQGTPPLAPDRADRGGRAD